MEEQKHFAINTIIPLPRSWAHSGKTALQEVVSSSLNEVREDHPVLAWYQGPRRFSPRELATGACRKCSSGFSCSQRLWLKAALMGIFKLTRDATREGIL